MSYNELKRKHEENMARIREAIAQMPDQNTRLASTVERLTAERNEWWQRAEAAQAKAIRWTPVTEALPPTMLRVLACYNDGRMTIILKALYMPAKTWISVGDFDDGEWDETTEFYYYPAGWYEAIESGEYAFSGPLLGKVTHWAQLPKLPEAQP